MLAILKIPVVYLCAVVWWAVRAEPRPAEGAAVTASLEPPSGCDWTARRSLRRPSRRPGRPPARRAARARAEARA
jgi:hypothetical protein